MCSTKKSEDFSDESQQSLIDTECLSSSSPSSSSCSINLNNFEIKGESRIQQTEVENDEESSNSESSSIPSEINNFNRKRCKEHEIEKPASKNPRIEKSLQCIKGNNKKSVNYESVSSLSVSSSPEHNNDKSFVIHHNHHRLSAFHPHTLVDDGKGGSDSSTMIIINHAEILSKMEKELRDKGFQVDLNSNHQIFTDYNKSKYQSNTDHVIIEGKKVKTQSQVSSSSSSLPKSKLSFGIDRILSDENSSPDIIQRQSSTSKGYDDEADVVTSDDPSYYHISNKTNPNSDHSPSIRHHPNNNFNLINQHQLHNHHRHPNFHQHSNSNGINHHHHHPLGMARCTECYFLGRYCRNNGNLPYSPALLVNSSPGGGGGVATNIGVSASSTFSSQHPWMTSASIYENSPLLSPSAYHPSSGLPSTYGLNASNFSTMSSLVGCSSVSGGGRRKRSWSRAVFSSLQRKGLEKRFQIQKYITKPDRRQLAATLGLTDAQVKVWFQNRRMKWRLKGKDPAPPPTSSGGSLTFADTSSSLKKFKNVKDDDTQSPSEATKERTPLVDAVSLKRN